MGGCAGVCMHGDECVSVGVSVCAGVSVRACVSVWVETPEWHIVQIVSADSWPSSPTVYFLAVQKSQCLESPLYSMNLIYTFLHNINAIIFFFLTIHTKSLIVVNEFIDVISK